MGLIGSAQMLVDDCRRLGIRHVHIHSCATSAHVGALANILGDTDYSLTLHGDLPVYGTDHRAKMQRAKFVSAVTTPLQRSLRDTIGDDLRYPMISMGVDTARFRPDPAARIGQSPGLLTVATIARLHVNKGHRFFLRAMAGLRDEGLLIRYLVAGEGPERHSIEAEIAALGLGDQVELLGSLSEDRVLGLLQSVDVLALTSILQGEAAPVAVMEAMACGTPPVASIIGGTPDMISDGIDGLLVAQEDVGAIADAVRKLASDRAFRDALGVEARRTAEQKFDHRALAMQLLEEIRRDPQPQRPAGGRAA
jgi:glycosyltransferase involved in cell wall biosynthesis